MTRLRAVYVPCDRAPFPTIKCNCGQVLNVPPFIETFPCTNPNCNFVFDVQVLFSDFIDACLDPDDISRKRPNDPSIPNVPLPIPISIPSPKSP